MILTNQKEAIDESAGMQKGLDEMIEQRSDETLYYLDQIWVHLKSECRTLRSVGCSIMKCPGRDPFDAQLNFMEEYLWKILIEEFKS
ncbi:hypothetical protein Tco_1228229 [Tanacetum coccineum]